MNEKRQKMLIRRQKVRRDVLEGAISSESELSTRYGVSASTIRNDMLAIAEMVAIEMEETLPNEWAVAISRMEANALRAVTAFEESRTKQRPCKTCSGTGWIKANRIGKTAKRTIKQVKCPKKFAAMAWDDGRVQIHRLAVARAIGRCLEKIEVVHHIDQNEKNNKLENLMLFANDVDHQRFHNGIAVKPTWSGTPNVRPIEEKDWCNDCDGDGFITIRVPGNVAYLTEYRNSIKERAMLLGLYPKNGPSQHLHLHVPRTKIDVASIPSDMILEARKFGERLEQLKIENNPVDVSSYNVDSGDKQIKS